MSKTNKTLERCPGNAADNKILTIYGKGADVIQIAPELHHAKKT